MGLLVALLGMVVVQRIRGRKVHVGYSAVPDTNGM
jgi:hypothetical protein